MVVGMDSCPAINSQGETFIKELVEEQPDLILKEICIEYNKHFDRLVSCSTIDRTLKRMNITRKKTLFDGRKNTPKNRDKLMFYKNDIVLFEPEQLY